MDAVLRLVDALWHVVGLLLLLVLFAEYGIDGLRRLNRRLRYRRARLPERSATAAAYRGADWTVAYFDEFAGGVRVDWRPYVGWWQRPYRGRLVTLDERGLRPTPGEADAGADALRILCFGGSTMMGMGARDGATIAAVLARRLGDLGHRVAVTNFGQLGHNSTQEVISLQQALKAGMLPHLVLFYDGINEMACAEQTGRADRLFNEARRQAEFNLLHPDRRHDLMVAALMAAIPRTLRRLRRLTGLPLRGPLPQPEADLRAIDADALAGAVLATYAANLRTVRLLAREWGFRVLFFWQPVIATKAAKSPDEARFAADYTGDPAARHRLYNAVVAARRADPQIAAADDAFDLSRLFDDCGEPVYIDLYHLSETGNAAVAEAMLPAVAAALTAAGGRSKV